ncbi:MAG TPA: NAD(P)-binding domain-containing protein [Kineosporiaceae bacterium]|nr:NAD(P)-binding domain-containing protein [Kineosporiaceae bacterium]
MRRPPEQLVERMRIAVIGAGRIGGSLGTTWLKAGHDVVFGSRKPVDVGPGGAPATTVEAAISDADVVLLAVPGSAVVEVIQANGKSLAGKIVIDAVNRVGEAQFNSRGVIAAEAAGALYVRAFNTLGWENFVDPPDGADLFFAADPDAAVMAQELIAATGLRPVLVGDAEASATVDALLPLWFALVQCNGGNRRLALRVVA